MKHLLIITQRVDERDDLLGFFVDWIGEFAKRVEKLSVITLAEGTYNLPVNVEVYTLGKERGVSKLTQAYTLFAMLWKLVRQSDGVFAHMSPIFAILAWPFTFLFNKKLILWYLHRSVTVRLRVALQLVDVLVTAAKESLQIDHPKIVAVGHGIRDEKFITERNWSHWGKRMSIVSVGRISPIKNYETLLRAVHILRDTIPVYVNIIGRTFTPAHEIYREQLVQLSKNLNLQDIVTFKGFVPYTDIAPYYQQADVAINLSPTGGIDKVVLEAMASGCISMTSNEIFAAYFQELTGDLLFKHNDPVELAAKLKQISSWDQAMCQHVSRRMVEIAKSQNIPVVTESILKLF